MPPAKKTLSQEELALPFQLLTDSIGTLNTRIESTERDFLSHLQKVEDRLDQIVDLTKTVAILQQQSSQTSDHINEVRTQIRENQKKSEDSVARIHTRLDEISHHISDKFDLFSKELEIEIKSAKDTANNTEKELKQWLNRGWGAWAIFVIIIGGSSTMFYRALDSLEKERATVHQVITQHTSQLDRQAQLVEIMNLNSKEMNLSVKRLEQQHSDMDRQVEILRQVVNSGRK
jgi:methyl-accepting chemotaxis protein